MGEHILLLRSDFKKIENEINEMITELGSYNNQDKRFLELETTVKQVTLRNGNLAQIKITVTCDKDEFEEIPE